jgi:cAMP-binding proteins - catabolite gene activator and regulatory subunit of cAMP-dependent protein kinases
MASRLLPLSVLINRKISQQTSQNQNTAYDLTEGKLVIGEGIYHNAGGDLEIFEQEPMATTTIEALTPCVCLGLKREFVIEQMAMDPVFLKQLCLSLSRKLDRVIRNSALNLLHPLENRVASYILATATSNHEHQLVFSGNLSQIADLLGTSFRHLHRTLQLFCDQGILVKVKTNYRIEQLGELESRAVGGYVIT